MGWNNLTKLGYKGWSALKSAVSNAYSPIKQVVSTVHKGANFVDGLLDKAQAVGVPASLIDLIRDNPIYSTVQSTIEFADDLIEKDLPNLGGAVENFVEHNLFSKGAPNVGQGISQVKDIASQVKNIGSSINQRLPPGGAPNRNPSSRAFFGDGTTAG